MRVGKLSACAVVAAVLVAPGIARAQADGSEPIRITFGAPPGCPDEQAFTGELRARTARARLAWPGEAARTFRVTITRHAGSALGNLTIEDASGGAVREVTGKTCAEVVSALALITALAIDPRASTAPHPPTVGDTGPASPPPPGPPLPWWVGMPNDLAPPGLRLFPTGDLERGIVPPPLPVWIPPLRPEAHGVRWTSGADVILHGAIGPSIEPGAAVYFDIGHRDTDVLEPSFRFWLSTVNGGSVVQGASSASLHFFSTTFEGCPVQFVLEPFVRFYPCAALELGAIQGQGDGTVAHENRTRPWAAGDLELRSQWAIGSHFVLELQGGVVFPFIRDEFQLPGAPAATVYAVPDVGGSVGAGLGVRFP